MVVNWEEWIGKIVFIKLEDGQVFTYSKVLAYEEPFMSITDRSGFPVVFRVSNISKIKEDLKERGEKEDAK